jgi:flagellar hook-associated protein 3 FlgL
MRVATRSFYRNMQDTIVQLSSELKKVNEKVSSGKTIRRPSDDPSAFIDIQGLKNNLSRVDQYARNLETGRTWLQMSESAMQQVLGVVDRAKEISIQMSNDDQNAETRAKAAIEVGQLLDQAVSLGSTMVGDSYLFAGYKTHTAPFIKSVVGGVETVQYLGDAKDFQIAIGKNEVLTAGRDGESVFMDSNLFQTLGNLRRVLEVNDANAVRQQLDLLDEVASHFNNQIADVGISGSRLDSKQEVLFNLGLTLQERLSNVEDADYASAIIELKEKEMAYQAALLSASRLSQLSLMNYL